MKQVYTAKKGRSYMDNREFIISDEYRGYVFMGWAAGLREPMPGEGSDLVPYYNVYVVSPVSSFRSEQYEAFGYKAEKFKCTDAGVWKDLCPGDRVKLFFDDKKKVQMIVLDQ